MFFLAIELGFFGANPIKIAHGGWFPLVVGALLFTAALDVEGGRALLAARIVERLYPFDEFLARSPRRRRHRVPGTAVFMTSNPGARRRRCSTTSSTTRSLHERVILLTVADERRAARADGGACRGRTAGRRVLSGAVRYGFMEEPDIPAALAEAAQLGLPIAPDDTTYFLGTETLIGHEDGRACRLWRERLFVLMSRNALRATHVFQDSARIASSRSGCRSSCDEPQMTQMAPMNATRLEGARVDSITRVVRGSICNSKAPCRASPAAGGRLREEMLIAVICGGLKSIPRKM